MIALMLVTDGRQDCCKQTLASLDALIGLDSFDLKLVVDDGCDREYSAWLDTFGFDVHLKPERRKRGFGGAINAGWTELNRNYSPDYVFHLEDDFVFSRFVPLKSMQRILEDHPSLVQVALKRQPWNEIEREAGDLIAVQWDAFAEQRDDDGNEWYEHRLWFTTNPSLYRGELIKGGWPTGEFSEGRFSHRLLVDPETRFGYMGRKADEPWVIHVGAERTGTGY